MSDDKQCAATPSADLEQQIMSYSIPKNEREWWAMHEIEKLRSKLERAKEGLKEIREATNGRDEVSFFTINTRARATLEELK